MHKTNDIILKIRANNRISKNMDISSTSGAFKQAKALVWLCTFTEQKCEGEYLETTTRIMILGQTGAPITNRLRRIRVCKAKDRPCVAPLSCLSTIRLATSHFL